MNPKQAVVVIMTRLRLANFVNFAFKQIGSFFNMLLEKTIYKFFSITRSDTGPNSVSISEMENNDPRTFLARRLNDWFNNVTLTRLNTRTNPQSNEVINLRCDQD
jgi:hypothetical protein